MKHFSSFGRSVAALLLLAVAPLAAQAQTGGVGIGTTAPDASAALDIVSSSKGLLLPRVAAATSIASPAPGLLVYQTDAPAGFYYNSGTAAAPNWQRLATASSGTGDNLGNHTATTNIGLNGNWLSNAPGNANGLRVDNAGSVGIGTASPTQALDVNGGILARGSGLISNQGAYLQWNRSGSQGETWLLSQKGGGLGGIRFGASDAVPTGTNTVTEWGRFDENGKLGLGTTSPSQKLDVTGNTNVTGNSYVSGNVGIGTTTPRQKLEVAGQIYSSTGGIRFPDNTVQTTAALTAGSAVLNQTSLQSGANFNVGGNGNVAGTLGVGTSSGPAASAALEVSSTTKGLLPPRMDQPQRDAIASPATGLTIYNTTTNALNVWDGTRWAETLTANSQPYANAAVTFTPTGAVQTYTVPVGVTRLTVDAQGARGGGNGNDPRLHGGGGARVQGQLIVTPGQTLYLYVGQQGQVAPSGGGGAGYNGGGNGGYSGGYQGYGGGGATDIRTSASGTAYTDRLLVAGGGGGAGAIIDAHGGASGLNGTAGSVNTAGYGGTAGTGGTQTAGGSQSGALGQGGSTDPARECGGGGGGYYGGGAGSGSTNQVAGGGGGSSWTDPAQVLSPTVTTGYNLLNGSLTLTPGLAYAAPAISGANIVNVPGTWTVSGADVYRATGAVGIGTGSIAASAQLEVASTTRGFLPPRLTQAQVDAIASPAPGLVIYNTDTNKLNVWNGTSWTEPINIAETTPVLAARTFAYTGAAQTYRVPPAVTTLQVDALGAKGGPNYNGQPGGAGARTQATLTVTPGEVLTIYVGGKGNVAPIYQYAGNGFNGGGTGYYLNGGGGGATDLRRGAAALADRLLVAGGGGGSAGNYSGGYAGFNGAAGNGSYPGGGGTQSGGGSGLNAGATGSLGQGGNADTGGGGGYYGGGGGYSASAGGGSSYVTPTGSSAITYTSSANADDGLLTLTPVRSVPAPVLSGANFVNVPGDNLGNHTATQNLNLAANLLTGNGGSTGLAISSAGNVGIGTSGAASQKLEVAGGIKFTGAGNALTFPDGSTQTTAAGTGTNFILNQTGIQSGATFNVVNGTVNNVLNVTGSLVAATATISNLNVPGPAAIGSSSSTVQLTGSALSLTGPTSITGNASISGTSTVGGTSTITGNSYVNGALGVALNGQNQPLITRGYDLFTSGSYSGAGRWGVFMEPSTLTVGVPAAAGKNFQWATYNANSAIAATLMTLSQGGRLGLGTPSPATSLDVRTADATAAITVGSTADDAGALYFGNPNHGLKRNYNGGNNVGLYTTSGNLYLSTGGSGGTSEFVLTGGKVGIGTGSPQAPLQVSGIALVGGGTLPNTTNATGIGWNAVSPGIGESELYNYRGSGSGGFRFFSVAGTGAPGSGDQIAFISSTGVYSALSDRRVKTNIAPLGQGLRTVLALRPVSYDFHTSRQLKDGVVTFLPDDKPVHALGFVAQDLLQVVPEAVDKPKDEKKEFYTVSYTTLVPVLTQAIQEQQAQIEELKKQNAALQGRAKALEDRAATAEAQAAHATATLETFEARLRRLEAGSAQAQR